MAKRSVQTEPGSLRDAGAQRKPSQTDLAHARLKSMILSGEIGPADQIDASRLASVLELGRTPIREALLRLQMEGIVRIVPKRGVQIVMLSTDDITEIYQVISAVEVEAVRLLVRSRPTVDQLGRLVDACQQMKSAGEQGDREHWIQADESFHRALLELNPNVRLRNVGMIHRDLAQRAHFVAIRLLRPEQLVKSAKQHNRLIKLIASGDEASAVQEHQLQRDRGAALLVDVLREYHLVQI